jgi:hypothetical protein
MFGAALWWISEKQEARELPNTPLVPVLFRCGINAHISPILTAIRADSFSLILNENCSPGWRYRD